MNRGFFSAFLAGFAIILMITVLYASTARTQTQSHVDETLLVQQELSKDWFLARNVFTNFTADAMMSKISASPPSAASCSVSIANYSDVVQTYWTQASNYMKNNYSVDCVATLNADLKSKFEGAFNTDVSDNARAYAILSCSRTIGGTTLSLQHPFVIKKDIIATSVASPAGCRVDIYDVLGFPSPDPAGLDVSTTFP